MYLSSKDRQQTVQTSAALNTPGPQAGGIDRPSRSVLTMGSEIGAEAPDASDTEDRPRWTDWRIKQRRAEGSDA